MRPQTRRPGGAVGGAVARRVNDPPAPSLRAAGGLWRRYGREVPSDPATFDKLTGTIVRQVGDPRRMVDEFSSFARMPKPAFALESLGHAAICAGHLSRLAEEMVIWTTPQFGFIRLSDAFSTGSSIMPQKRNPDAAELVRAKTGRITGSRVALLPVMQGLPPASSHDMQADKPPWS